MKQERFVSLDELEKFLGKNKVYPKGIEKDDLYGWFEWIVGNTIKAVKREDIEEALQKALNYWGIGEVCKSLIWQTKKEV